MNDICDERIQAQNEVMRLFGRGGRTLLLEVDRFDLIEIFGKVGCRHTSFLR